MPRGARAQKFLIDPLAVTRDPVRRLMCTAARGIYDTLWMESWMEKEPGVLPSSDTILAGLAQVTLEEWNEHREQVVTGFTVTRDTWRCTAVTATKYAQDSMRDGWRKRQSRKRERERDSGVMSPVGSSTGSGTGAGTDTEEPTPSVADAPALPGFDRFWTAYACQRRRKKPAALAEWKRQRCESIADAVLAGLERYKLSEQWRDGFMPEPHRWLKGRGWEDEPTASVNGSGGDPDSVWNKRLPPRSNATDTMQRATCHRCLKHFTRPQGSMQDICGACRV